MVFLAFFIFLPKFAFLVVEDFAGQGVAGFLPVELGVDPAAQQFVVVVAGQVGGAVEFAQLYQGVPDRGGGAAADEVANSSLALTAGPELSVPGERMGS